MKSYALASSANGDINGKSEQGRGSYLARNAGLPPCPVDEAIVTVHDESGKSDIGLFLVRGGPTTKTQSIR